MNNTVDKVVANLAKYFNQIFDDLEGIYLFGAYLDGEMHEDEDIELAAIFKIEDKSKREQIWPIIGKVETEMGVGIDLYPYTQETFEQDKEIYNEVMAEGIFYNKNGKKE